MADPAAPDGTTPVQAPEGPQQRPVDAPATTTAPGPADATPSEPGTYDLLPGELTPHLPHGPGPDEPSREVPTGVEPPLPLPREPDGVRPHPDLAPTALPDAASAGLAADVTLPDLNPVGPAPLPADPMPTDRPTDRPSEPAARPPADPATRVEPLGDNPPLQLRTRLTVTPLGPALRYALRGPESAAAAAAGTLGLHPPAFLRASAGSDHACLMLGPDEWLLLAPDGDAADLFGRLDAAIAEPHSLVDVSHRNTGLTVTGALAAEVLNSGCPLDLDPAAFPVGMATRTLFAKAEIVLWRTGPDAFRIEVWRSYAPYLYGLLAETARDYHR